MKISIALLSILLSSPALADIELSLGECITRHPSNGVWWQDPFPNKIQNKSPCYSVGYRFDNGWAFGYEDLGKYSTWAKASASDDNYDGYRAGTEEIWPLSTWIGKGSVKGLYLNRKFQHKWGYSLAGIHWHETLWKMHVPDWRHESFEGTRPITVTSNQRAVSWTLGIGKDFGQFSAQYEIKYVDGGSAYKPSYSGPAQVISLVFEF